MEIKNQPMATKIVCSNCSTSTPTEQQVNLRLYPDFDHMMCNYCPYCEDDMQDYYEEWYVDSEGHIIEEIS